MGIMIDVDRLKEVFSRNVVGGNAYFDLIDNAPTVEAIPKDQYEVKLKADMIAMLEDLDLQIDEMYEPQFSKEGMDGFYWAQGLFKALVQQKIDKLRGEESG